MPTMLRNGSFVEDPRLARLYQLDWRSLDFPISEVQSKRQRNRSRSYTWEVPVWLDQGEEGACVGFGFAHELAARPVPVEGIGNAYARERIYWPAQREDEWGGGSYPGAVPFYEGTSVLAGAKVVTMRGYYSEYRWALDVQDLAVGVGFTGPAVLGLNWYSGMFDTDEDGFIHVEGRVEGGHCICANGVRIVWKSLLDWTMGGWDGVDLDKSYLKLRNSWGKDWGRHGNAKLSLSDAERLLAEEGDACFPIRNTHIRDANIEVS